MNHPLDRPVASDLSYLCLQKRRERGELQPCGLDSRNQRLYAIPSMVANRHRFIAEHSEWLTDASGSHRVETITPSFNGRQK